MANQPARQPADDAGAPAFDVTLGGWVVRRHADVVEALRHPGLVAIGTPAGGEGAHLAVRAAAVTALPAQHLTRWREAFESSARRLVAQIPAGEAVDLVERYAVPWSFEVASRVTGVSSDVVAQGAPLARALFLAAAEATDGTPSDATLRASAALSALLAGHAVRANTAVDVQAFVALTQTLPTLLAGAWLQLLRHPGELSRLRHGTVSRSSAMEELLRLGSPSQTVFREAHGDVALAGVRLPDGARVVVMLADANRDPSVFASPDVLDLGRDGSATLAFGTGAHRCVGAALIRLAVEVATLALVEGASSLVLETVAGEEPPRVGGFAIRAPADLWVRLIHTT